MRRTSLTRDQQEQWAVQYLSANLSKEEVQDAGCSITVQAFADFFAAQWPKTFNKMHFAAKVRQAAQEPVPKWIGSTAKKERSVQMFDRLLTLPQSDGFNPDDTTRI